MMNKKKIGISSYPTTIVLGAFFLFSKTVLKNASSFQLLPSQLLASQRRITSPDTHLRDEFVRTSALFSTTGAQSPAISIESLSCSHDGGETYQLDDVSYVLQRGAKMALVGRNGAGKSTLLKILAEKTCFDFHANEEVMKYEGEIITPRDVRVAFVEQEPPMPSDVSVADALLGIRGSSEQNAASASNKDSIFAVVRRYMQAVARAEEDPGGFSAASAAMDSLSGSWDVLTKAEEVATKLRVQHLRDQSLSNLSGGERKRVALAAALVQEPDVLLLDEPTNFLSLAGVQWLADLLTSDKKLTVLTVTHDRAFLEETCDRILELDRGKLYEYDGSYSEYLIGKEERLAVEDAATQAAKTKYRVELEWMRRQPQARESKSKARIEAFYKLEKATKPRPIDPKLLLETDGQRRIGGKILSIRNANLRFGDRVMLDDFSYDFCKGDRICIAGANGVGKTTFVRVITGDQPLDDGEIEVGESIKLGVYDQLGLTIEDDSQTMLEFVVEQVQSKQGLEVNGSDEARSLLRKFEFPRNRWNERVSVLSGGEKRRLQMLSVLSEQPNFLIMDEPSVDCDLDTLQALENFLLEFKGVLLVVSHDRMFSDKVADHLFVFEGNGAIKDFPGTLSEYASTLVELENEIIVGSAAEDSSSSDRRETYKQNKTKRNEERNNLRKARRRIEKLDTEIEDLRCKATLVQKDIDESSGEGWTVLAELTKKLDGFNQEIEDKEMEWMELAEFVEGSEIEV